MKCTPKEDVKSMGRTFEEGSPFDSVKQGIPDELVERWYENGWIEIEGREPSPERQVRGVVIRPDSTVHQQKETKNG